MSNLHSFHIPVMGLAYTIDPPSKGARFGISSVLSLANDNLIERMRRHYAIKEGIEYTPITQDQPDRRARRITAYLDLVQTIVDRQIEALKQLPFDGTTDLDRYFIMLPESSDLRKIYMQMQDVKDPEDKIQLEHWLRMQVIPGSIDVNIMTKLDRDNLDEQDQPIESGSDAVAAIRGYANSKLSHSSVVLSAGLNPRLFSYMEKLDAFNGDRYEDFSKQIIIKVSDYRSALIQGKMLAKKGLWVSEFRIESGLNCGGHAFASDGFLIGPILEEFKCKKQELTATLFGIYNQALEAKGRVSFSHTPEIRITVQGGIGTASEDAFLRSYYQVDSTGWGTPFLLVPEATTVDDNTRTLLTNAQESDVHLSKNSPLGVRFHYLRGTSADLHKQNRIRNGKPGIACTEKYLAFNTEFSAVPICTASHKYQMQKVKQLETLGLPEQEYNKQLNEVLTKECLCQGLSNAAYIAHQTEGKKADDVNICPGPNIAYFNEKVSLARMIDHIYGRTNLVKLKRPHMFIKELRLYVDYWCELLEGIKDADPKQTSYVKTFHQNLLNGIAYYRSLGDRVNKEFADLKEKITAGLDDAERQLNDLLDQFQGNTAAIAAA